MAETVQGSWSRLRWIIVGVIGVVAVGIIVWGIIVNLPNSSEAGPGAVPTATPVEDLPVPDPGKTTPIEKSKPPVSVKLTERAEPLTGVFVEVVSVESVTAGRAIPGEPTGPAVMVEVRLVNESSKPVDAAGASISLTYNGEDQTPAVALTSDIATNWPAEVPAGESASSVFVFSLPDVVRGDIRVIVDLLAMGPDVVFEGPRP
ncbi:hypothetical protein ACXR2T_08670 [Leucobacter sp. HY1910]